MSKPLSGLFTNTSGYTAEALSRATDIRPLHSTAEVWTHITATDDTYPGSPIPRSFIVETPSGNYWANPNGTKHMDEALNSVKDLPALKNTNPDLMAQFILYDFREAIIEATSSGPPKHKEAIHTNHWVLVFNQRPTDEYPVVYHAQFLGLN